MDVVTSFEAERPRLVRIAAGLLGDRHEAEDVVQQAWLRLDRTDAEIESLPAWLTTVTTRLCLDRLRARVPDPVDTADPLLAEDLVGPDGIGGAAGTADPAEHVALADTVGVALQVLLERLSPTERVAFVLHDTFGVDFGTVAQVLDVSPAAARKQASRARAKVTMLAPDGPPADWEVVDAFLAAARGGDFARLLHLLAPDVVITADAEAIATGTPERLEGREAVAAMFDGAASAALPTLLDGRPGLAWFHQGQARVVFDFRVEGGQVTQITFRAAPDALAHLVRRKGADPHPTAR